MGYGTRGSVRSAGGNRETEVHFLLRRLATVLKSGVLISVVGQSARASWIAPSTGSTVSGLIFAAGTSATIRAITRLR